VDVSTGREVDRLGTPDVNPGDSGYDSLTFGDGKLWVGWWEEHWSNPDDIRAYHCWIDPETGEYGPAVKGGAKTLHGTVYTFGERSSGTFGQ